MSQRIIRILDYKDRPLAEAYMLADGGIAFDFDHESQITLLSQKALEILELKKEIECLKEKLKEGLSCCCAGCSKHNLNIVQSLDECKGLID
jgi:Zn finger protein HypA/HybF involved in hydrogenase expression